MPPHPFLVYFRETTTRNPVTWGRRRYTGHYADDIFDSSTRVTLTSRMFFVPLFYTCQSFRDLPGLWKATSNWLSEILVDSKTGGPITVSRLVEIPKPSSQEASILVSRRRTETRWWPLSSSGIQNGEVIMADSRCLAPQLFLPEIESGIIEVSPWLQDFVAMGHSVSPLYPKEEF